MRNVAVLVITADRGMCGNYNVAACRLASDLWERSRKAGRGVTFFLKGKKAERYFRRRGVDIAQSGGWRRDGVHSEEIETLLALLLDQFLSGRSDEVYAVYTQFFSPIRRLPQVRRLLPVTLERTGRSVAAAATWHYEPSFREIFHELLAIYLRVQLHDVLLESFASEQGARMITMDEATERAEKTLQECRVLYNRLRRETITIDLLGVLFASKVVEEVKSTPGRLA